MQTDPMQPQIDAALSLAQEVAGDDDAAVVALTQQLLNVSDGFANPREPALGTSRSTLVPGGRADPDFVLHAMEVLIDQERIIGGVEVPPGEFLDCVAIGTADQWCCTGTLIAVDRVVTAAHCVAGTCGERVYIGSDVADPSGGVTIAVRRAVVHPEYRPPRPDYDIAILLLDRPAGVPPRRIAAPELVDAASSVRVVGFGNTDVMSRGGYGRKRLVDVPIAGSPLVYGADPATEFAAGAPLLDRDSCQGDSGGPAYVYVRGEWLLAGATSRAVPGSTRPCGDGGVYTRVGVFADWLMSAS